MFFDYSDHHGDYVTWIVRTDNERWISLDNKRGLADAKKDNVRVSDVSHTQKETI